MKLCRYNDNKLGIVENEQLIDVTEAIEVVPEARWPRPHGDGLIANLATVKTVVGTLKKWGFVQRHASVGILSPVANPTKVIGAPTNYGKHIDEAQADPEISLGRPRTTIEDNGLFLKSPTLVGPSDGVALQFPDRRQDHEVELAMIIGETCKNVAHDDALDVVAGYAIGLDMTVRGVEDRSMRKACDGYSVLGPWLVTADEIDDPDSLELSISVNGEERQRSTTRDQIFDCRRLIEYASSFYTLYPGDVIMTGTPEGVGPVQPGDVMHCEIERIGAMDVEVRAER
jgi:2-keto-4-pentenoate hydratase/2-oxohepta-3-ene-1,7-dioic acid hydratase in catechol pathway